MKKFIIILTIICLCLATFSGCGNNVETPYENDSVYDEIEGKNEIESEQESSSSGKDDLIERQETEETNIEYKEVTYTRTDSSGYVVEIKWKLSPWIENSNADIINSVWAEIGCGKTLPSNAESWGLENNIRHFQIGSECFAGDSFLARPMTESYYYCMGTVEIANKTSGWDFSSSQPYLAEFYLPCLLDIDDTGTFGAATIARTFYSNGSSDYANHIKIRTTMKSNATSTIPFVIIAPESYSPDYPDGKYFNKVHNGFFVSSLDTAIGQYDKTSDYTGTDQFYIGIYDKDGQYTPPIK